MPGDLPDNNTGDDCHARAFPSAKDNGLSVLQETRCFLKTGTAYAAAGLLASAGTARAAEGTEGLTGRFLQTISSNEILMLAVFGGAMSFALLSAFWLIRERSRILSENARLKKSLTGLRATSDRNEALVSIPEQRIVVWNVTDKKPEVLGTLSGKSGAPEDEAHFLAFAGWLDSSSAGAFEQALRELRLNAKGFDKVITSKGGGIVEAQGRTSGGYAYVRFREIGTERQDHARLKSKYDGLKDTFNTMESLFARLPMPLWLRDGEGRLRWSNQAYADALEVADPKEAVKRNGELFDHDQRNELQNKKNRDGFFEGILPATVAGDRKKLQVFDIRTGTGSAGMATDKSDVEKVRAHLNETIDSHAKMLDQLATAVAIFDKSQKLTFYNSGFRQLWNLEPAFLDSCPTNAEILDAMRDKNLLPDHPDWKKWRQEQLGIYTSIEPAEDWWHLLDGQTLRVVVSPQNQGGVTWIFENVTERLALESNYNSLMRVQGETLDHLNEAVAVFGSNGKLRLFNPALESLWQPTGLEIDEGLHIAQVIEAWGASVSDHDDLENILGKVTGFNDERASLKGRLVLQDGIILEYSLVPLPEGQSMLTFIDVTASVNFETALRERAEALEASDHLKSKFIQHVSYELRAPLTNIAGFGEMLTTPEIGSMNEKQAEYLSHINTSAEELRAIVDDILDLASIDAGAMILDIEPVQLADTVNTVFEMLDQAIASKKIKKTVRISKQSALLKADQSRLIQILQNLVSNAISFSPDGGKISVSAKRDGDLHEIRVSDEGPGIADENRKAVFDRFETRSPDGTRQGTGLGLSIVKSFIELHGGDVRVEKAGKRGACFVCRFPVSPVVNDTGMSPAADHVAAA